jgi:uncharacterized protein YjbI with pentapeptide repeats
MHFEYADFTITHLDDADLGAAHLKGADLTGAHLNRALLDDTDLTGAHLNGTQLNGADLWAADLRDAKGLTQEQVNSAQCDEKTRLPKGIDLPPLDRPKVIQTRRRLGSQCRSRRR